MKIIQQAGRFFLGIIATLALQTVFSAEPEVLESVTHKVYLTTENRFGDPATKPTQIFDCAAKIFAVVELIDHPIGTHQLSVRWTAPDQSLQEHTQYPFHTHQRTGKIWAWLSLSRAMGAGLMKLIDPAAGFEEFIGEWFAEVRINNRLLEKKKFQVIC